MRETRAAEPAGRAHEDKVTGGLLAGGSSLEVLGGGIAIVLAILGLAGLAPVDFAAIAAIVIGGALLAFSGALAMRWRQTIGRVREERDEGMDVAGGVGTEALGGAAGVVLGILALIGIAPLPLLAIAAICLGAGVLFGGAGQAELDVLGRAPESRRHQLIARVVRASGGVMAVAGAGAVVLGILGVIGVQPILGLVLVSMLALGGGLVVGGAAGAFRFVPSLRHRTA